MRLRKNNLLMYGIVVLLISITFIGQVDATSYENYFGIKMTSQEYNTLLNLGFTEDEIYYMNEETYLENKNSNANLVSTNEKYYKTIYTDLIGNSYTMEVNKSEYENQPSTNARGTVETEYKKMITTLSENGSKFRYKVSVLWKSMPSKRSYDIIGIGFDDDVYISSSVYFNYHYCLSSGTCYNESYYVDKKSTSTGGSAVYDLPNESVSLSATLYYDVSKDTSSTITRLDMYGDYAHATSNVSVSNISNYDISYLGIELGSSLIGKYDSIPCAISSWTGSW